MPSVNKSLKRVSQLPLFRAEAFGPLLMLGSAFMFAVLDGLIKTIGPEFRVWDIAFYRWGGSFVVLMILFSWQKNTFKSHNLKLMLARSISGCIAFLTLIASIRLIPVSTAMVLFYVFPSFAAIFSFLLFGERISRKEICCIIGTLLGVMILLEFRLEGNFLGHTMGLVSGAFAGLTVSLIKKLREKDGAVVIYLYFCLFGAIVALPGYISDPRIPQSVGDWMMTGGIVFSSMVAQLLMTQGFKYCKSWEGGLFLTCEMIFVAVFGIYYLGEPTTWRFWAGGLLILGSVLFLNRVKTKQSAFSETSLPEAQPTVH